MLFIYLVVPRGGAAEQALAKANLYAMDIEGAKRYIETATVRHVAETEVDVILQDLSGNEIWRGPYRGSVFDPNGRTAQRERADGGGPDDRSNA